MDEVNRIHEEEKQLTLTSFNSSDAWRLGNWLVEWGCEHKKIIVIRISVNHHVLFQYAFDGTAVENDNWAIRKENIVYYTGHSSYAVSLYLNTKQQTPTERYGIPADKFAASGGSVPICLQGTGVIGAVTVSGMSQKEDHELVVAMLKKYQTEVKA